MGSLIFKVLRDKGKAKSSLRQSQKQKIDDLKTESVYSYKVREEFKKRIDPLLDDDEVSNIHIVIPERYISIFMKIIFREEFTEYKISQVSGREFEVSRKEIYL